MGLTFRGHGLNSVGDSNSVQLLDSGVARPEERQNPKPLKTLNPNPKIPRKTLNL